MIHAVIARAEGILGGGGGDWVQGRLGIQAALRHMARVVANGRQRLGRNVQPALVLGTAWDPTGERTRNDELLHDLVCQARCHTPHQRDEHAAAAHEHAADWLGRRSQDR